MLVVAAVVDAGDVVVSVVDDSGAFGSISLDE